MPVMGGNVQDEGNFGIGNTEYFTGPPQVPITAAQYIANVTAAYSGPEYPGGPNYPAGTADQVLAKYPPGSDPQATYDLVTTYPGACRNRHIDALWAQAGLPVYAYEFNDQNAPYYYPPMPGFTPLAAHTIDIQFLFPLWHGGILGVLRGKSIACFDPAGVDPLRRARCSLDQFRADRQSERDWQLAVAAICQSGRRA